MTDTDKLQAVIAPKRGLSVPSGSGTGPPEMITATVTVEESHTDRLTITDHPVEQGASITDHAYKEPAQVTLQACWSASDATADGDEAYLRTLYDRLRRIQADRTPFDLFTGKVDYQNMLIENLSCTTDRKSENVLMVTMHCRQVILVSTVETTIPSDRSVQAAPEETASEVDVGNKQGDPISITVEFPDLDPGAQY